MEEVSWVVKYAPKHYSELMVPAKPYVKKFVKDLFEGTSASQAVLLYGKGGSGKSTLIELLSEQPGAWQIKKLATTGEKKNSIDSLINTLSTVPFSTIAGVPARHLVIGDEIEQSSTEFLDGLRSVLDMNKRLPKADQFLLLCTTNHFDKLTSTAPELVDRMQCLEWDLIPPTDILVKLRQVLLAEKLYTEANYKLATTLVKQYHPSVRKCLTELQLQAERPDEDE